MRRRSTINGRLAASLLVLLLAGLLAACGSAQAAREVPVARSEAVPTQRGPSTPSESPTRATLATSEPATTRGAVAEPAAGSPAPPKSSTSATLPPEARTSDGGAVTVQVTPDSAAGGDLSFSVSLTTHSVDLTYDYRASASLRDNQGRSYPATRWDGGSGGHHVSGKLIFARDALSTPGVQWVELQLKGIAGVPARTFRWDVR